MKKITRDQNSTDLIDNLQAIVMAAYQACGYDQELGQVVRSKIPELAHYQSNGAFLVAKKYRVAPMEVAEKIAAQLKDHEAFRQVTAVAPGFVNMFLSDAYLVSQVKGMITDEAIKLPTVKNSKKIILDFGGANVAKPLHVGHLRSAIIGESIKRIGRFLGHEVIGDVHLGDWGLQMGMIIIELAKQRPELPYFDPGYAGAYPEESPVSMADLDVLYPQASQRAKADETVMDAARRATVELQEGRPGYRALWKKVLAVSIADLRKDYSDLDVDFDLWLGESDAHEAVAPLIDILEKKNLIRVSEGALIMEVCEPDDAKPLPPLMLKNTNGAELYGVTDLATIKQRIEKYAPDEMIYVVDKRQSLHLEQVFRGARLAGIVDEKVRFEHVDFGTMNGTDNKPFKTRAGGTMKLKDLIALIFDNAMGRLRGIDYGLAGAKADIARKVGIATLKFADLSNYRTKDYIFDIERFSAFEGHTGPYLLYSAARANSILSKAEKPATGQWQVIMPETDIERDLLLKLLEFHQAIIESWDDKSPKEICDYAYDLAVIFSKFYHECPVLSENDIKLRESRLFLVEATSGILECALNLLGIEVPDRM